jgi:hypothetical protein
VPSVSSLESHEDSPLQPHSTVLITQELRIFTSLLVKESEVISTDFPLDPSEMSFSAQSKRVSKNSERKCIPQSLSVKEELGIDLMELSFTAKIMLESLLITKAKPKVALLLDQSRRKLLNSGLKSHHTQAPSSDRLNI